MEENIRNSTSILSMVFGILTIVFSSIGVVQISEHNLAYNREAMVVFTLLPLFSLIGLILGLVAHHSTLKNIRIAGIVLNSIGIGIFYLSWEYILLAILFGG
jgi:hypothetical protein